jgi:hypothetical protein
VVAAAQAVVNDSVVGAPLYVSVTGTGATGSTDTTGRSTGTTGRSTGTTGRTGATGSTGTVGKTVTTGTMTGRTS